jgi:mannose-6-phosphate isomerase class I
VTSVQILVGTKGSGRLTADGHEEVAFSKGDAVVVPATVSNFKILPQGRLEFLKSYVPGKPVGEPETVLYE